MIIEYVFCLITSFFAGLNIQKYFNISNLVQDSWAELQCTPYGSWLYPFFGPKSISITDNQAHCDSGKFNSMFNLNMLSHSNNLNFLHDITSGLSATIQEFRKKFANIEQAIFKDINNIWQRIWAVYIRIVQVFMVIFQIVEHLLKLFISGIDVMSDAYCMLGSIWNGPIGGAARYFCFDGNTLIKMDDGTTQQINNIKVDDLLENNNKVLSIYKFSSKNVQIFKYNNVIVSGSHLVLEDSKWIRVVDSKLAEKIDYNKKFIYSIQTENNTIITDKNVIFSDSEESEHFIPNTYYINKILDLLNNEINSLDTTVDSINNSKLPHNYNNCDYDIYLNGIYGNNKILLESGKYTKIKNIKIGDKLINGATVIGRCKRNVNNIQLYRHKNIILSGYDIVNYNNKWMPVYECPVFDKYYNKNIKYLYHVQTDLNNIRIKNFEILSVVPVASNDSKEIDKCFEKYVNESYKSVGSC